MQDHDPTRSDRGADDAGPSRAVIVAFVFVAILAVAGYFGTKALIQMGRLQDCAATGRRDC